MWFRQLSYGIHTLGVSPAIPFVVDPWSVQSSVMTIDLLSPTILIVID